MSGAGQEDYGDLVNYLTVNDTNTSLEVVNVISLRLVFAAAWLSFKF